MSTTLTKWNCTGKPSCFITDKNLEFEFREDLTSNLRRDHLLNCLDSLPAGGLRVFLSDACYRELRVFRGVSAMKTPSNRLQAGYCIERLSSLFSPFEARFQFELI